MEWDAMAVWLLQVMQFGDGYVTLFIIGSSGDDDSSDWNQFR
jgi:hypothetical protein